MLNFECKRCLAPITTETQYIGDVLQCPSCGSAEIVPDTPFPKGSNYCGYIIQSLYESDLLWTVYQARRADMPPEHNVLLKVPTMFFLKHVSDFTLFADSVIRNGTLNMPEFPLLTDRSIAPGHIYFAYEHIPATHGLRFFTKIEYSDILAIIRSIAVALKSVWDKNLVLHQNLTPQNIRLTKEKRIRIHNVGLSGALLADHSLLDWGFNIWDARYMSPEFALQGIADTPACDIYALGGTLFYLLTGHHPYASVNPADIPRIPVPDPTNYNRGIPPELLSLFSVMMAKDISARMSSWDQVITGLDTLLSTGTKQGNMTQFTDRYHKSDTAKHPRQENHFARSKPHKKVFVKNKKKQDEPVKKPGKRLKFNTDTAVMKLDKIHSKWKKR